MAPIKTPFLTFPDDPFASDPHEFQALTSDAFAGGFVDDDGDEALILAIAQLLDADSAALGDLDGFLSAMDFVEGDFEGANISPLLGDIAAVLEAGDPLVTNFGNTVVTDTGGS